MKKVCLFGDSISKGVIIDELHNRYMVTKRSFANIISGCEDWMELKNYSMLGCTIEKGRRLINRHRQAVDDSDVVVLEYGGNDCDFLWDEIAAEPSTEHLPKTPLDDFLEDYREIITGLQGIGKEVVMINLPPLVQGKYFDWVSRGLSADNIMSWLGGTADTIYNYHEGYNDRICLLAEQYDIPLIDIRSAFLRLGDYSGYICEDGIHPNEEGHELIAKTIEAELPELVEKLRKKAG